ncbi:MAG: virulence protein RhuM/Fic/DOC family protein [Candidatus Komeilibacteria bacterium]|nr:virulence protein RhuM/Fic/DOC family protein [Candidatus Komeilibacteria bacterium]
MKKQENKEIIIYQAKSGAIELKGDYQSETIWASQAEMSRIFNVTPQNITLHLRNIFKEGELSENSTCKEYLQVRKEGNREIRRKIKSYNLDVIIAVGYRINSIVGTKFRQWATKILRTHIINGYTINRSRITQNYKSFMKSVANIQALLPEHVVLDPKKILDLIKEFAGTWVSLNAYDKESLKPVGTTKKAIKLTGRELSEAIAKLKTELVKKGEATELFATERQPDSIQGIVGNVMQSFGGQPLYKTLEEKAAHLLYFMVKNHPFTDGNKRSGAFAFIWFLRKARIKGGKNINQAGLTALTLLIAESEPRKKEQMTALVTQMLK